uniref:Peptidase S1 domain-containing protein n=1 Tax=Panagrolaimus davidi TaxID=227884 RepID=A0A914P4I7_9BILA
MGGNVTDPGTFNYSIVYIKSRRDDGTTGGCTGTMISERHLLTCLHCVINDNDGTFREHFTFDTIFDKDAEFHIKEIHKFRDHIDAAIIEFSRNTKFKHKNLHKVHLVRDDMLAKHLQDKIHNEGYIAGYGRFAYEKDKKTGAEVARESDGQLRIARVPIYPSKVCGSNVRICSSNGKLPYAYSGDSGGPLFFFQNQDSNITEASERDELDFNITHPKRHQKMYQFGIILSGDEYRTLSFPMNRLCDWIGKVTKWEAECEKVFENRGRRSASPPSFKAAEKRSPNFQLFENGENIEDYDISSKSDNSKVLPLSDLPKTEFEDEENGMDAEDLSCILNCINILILICLIILLCYYFCFKTSESNG